MTLEMWILAAVLWVAAFSPWPERFGEWVGERYGNRIADWLIRRWDR